MPQMWPSASTQAVAALAVGVVGDDVEHGHAPQLRVGRLVVEQGEVVLLEVGVDEPLQRALADGARPRARWSAGRRPSRGRRSARRPRPRGGRGRRGSPTAGARPRGACRCPGPPAPSRHASTRKVAFELHGMRPTISTSPARQDLVLAVSSASGTRDPRDRSAARRGGTAVGRTGRAGSPTAMKAATWARVRRNRAVAGLVARGDQRGGVVEVERLGSSSSISRNSSATITMRSSASS